MHGYAGTDSARFEKRSFSEVAVRVRLPEETAGCASCSSRGMIRVERHAQMVDHAFACPEHGSSPKIAAGLVVELASVKREEGPDGPG